MESQKDGTTKTDDGVTAQPYEAPLDPMTNREYIFSRVPMAHYPPMPDKQLRPMEYARTLKGRKKR